MFVRERTGFGLAGQHGGRGRHHDGYIRYSPPTTGSRVDTHNHARLHARELCAKTAELIEMPFRLRNRVDPWNHDGDPQWKGHCPIMVILRYLKYRRRCIDIQTHAIGLPWIIPLSTVVLIARPVFILEHGQRDAHTNHDNGDIVSKCIGPRTRRTKRTLAAWSNNRCQFCSHTLFISRIACGLLPQMSHAAWFLCLCVEHNRKLCKNGWTDWKTVRLVGLCGPEKETVIKLEPKHPTTRGTFQGDDMYTFSRPVLQTIKPRWLNIKYHEV